MTGHDLFMALSGTVISLMCIAVGTRFWFDNPVVMKEWRRLSGKILEDNDDSFTVEYGDKTCSHIYTAKKADFFSTMGYSPAIRHTLAMTKWIDEQKSVLECMLRRGHNTARFFRFRVGKKMYVWTDPENTAEVYKVWSDDKPANRSSGRAMIAFGSLLLLGTLLAVRSCLMSL